MALYPLALRDELGMRADSICMAYGMQVGSYRQLKDAVSFLDEHGVTIRYLPPELSPGIDYSAFALDPEGHAIQLYYYMEQIGWDGKPRPRNRAPQNRQRRLARHARRALRHLCRPGVPGTDRVSHCHCERSEAISGRLLRRLRLLAMATYFVIASAAKQSPWRRVAEIASSPFGRLAMTRVF